ncbi:hypothetical protein MKW98_030734, partial [Papaver atlanticum]
IIRRRLLKVLSSVPIFENLIYLETKYIQAESILKLLQFTPNLESLVIVRTIEVRTFEGLRDQLQLVKYFLKNARILEGLIIESRYTSKSAAELERETQTKELLLMYPRASTNCKVKFQIPKH